ncbi:MAG: hypothetical protein ABIJ31_02475, partial [Pseudomonadota bacterium]
MKSIANKKTGFIGKSIIALISAVTLCIGAVSTPALAADATASVNVASAYVWRGQTFNDGAVVQPSVDVTSENGFGFNAWGNYDLSDYNNTVDSREFSEIDFTVSYGFSLEKLDIGVGVISYLFPAGAADTAEVYLSLGMEIIGGLSAAITGYYDFDALEEFSYSTFALSYGYDINDKLSAELGATIAYAGDKFVQAAGGVDSGFFDYTLSLSMDYAISEAWGLSAGVTYIDTADDDNLKEKSVGGMLDTN